MSLTSRLSLGNLRRNRLALFLIAAVVLTGAAVQWTWRSAQAVNFEEPMAEYHFGSAHISRLYLRPDSLGALALIHDHRQLRSTLESLHFSLVDVSRMTAPIASGDSLTIPQRGKTLLQDATSFFALYSPTSDRIAVANSANLRILNASSHTELSRLGPPFRGGPHAAFSPDGNWVAAIDFANGINLWNIAENSGPQSLPIAGAYNVAFGANSDELLVIKMTGDWEIVSLATRRPIAKISAVSSVPYAAAAIAQHGDRLAIGLEDGTICIWKLSDRTLEMKINAFPEPKMYNMRICFAGSDDSLVATCDIYRRELQSAPTFPFFRFFDMARNSKFRIWSVRDWRLRHSWQNTCSRSLYPDSRRLAFADFSGNTLRLWSLRPHAATE